MTGAAVEQRFSLGMENPLRATVMYPPAREAFASLRQAWDAASIASSLAVAMSPLGLYAHVPFCESRCAFCGFATVPLPRSPDLLDAYVDALARQFEACARALPRPEIVGLDIGGGTPGVLEAPHFERILQTAARHFRLADGFEASTETTARRVTADPGKWRAVVRSGVRRISLGLQTFDGELRRALGRADGDDARAVGILRAAGAPIVNVDLMFGLPGQTDVSWRATLDRALEVAPDVVTLYDTIYKRRRIARVAMPPQSTFGRFYDDAFGALTAAGYRGRYGSINFSRVAGRLGPSRYLEGRTLDGLDYVGTGLYASSLVQDSWRMELLALGDWLDRARRGELTAQDSYLLPKAHLEAKHLLLNLSFGYLDAARFERRFGRSLGAAHGPALRFLEETGRLRKAPDGWELVPGSFAELPGIRACFYPPEALPSLSVPARGER